MKPPVFTRITENPRVLIGDYGVGGLKVSAEVKAAEKY